MSKVDFKQLTAIATRASEARLTHSEAEERRIKPASLAPELRDAIDMEWESAKAAVALGYMAKLLCQVTMPHSKLKQTEIERVNGDLVVTMIAPSRVGLPYGTYPRLIMAHITKQAVLKRSPCIELGDNLSAYMAELGLSVTGGRWGSIARLREHLARLLLGESIGLSGC